MNPTIYVACIGSRETPLDILQWMEHTAADLVANGFGIISGNAPGADQAWGRGANHIDPSALTVVLPWQGFETPALHPANVVQLGAWDFERCSKIVGWTHPAVGSLTPAAMRLHARNVMIVEAASIVLGWIDPEKRGGGGTGMAFKLGRLRGVPCVNVAQQEMRVGVLERVTMRAEYLLGRKAA